jgi:hypothetical protein
MRQTNDGQNAIADSQKSSGQINQTTSSPPSSSVEHRNRDRRTDFSNSFGCSFAKPLVSDADAAAIMHSDFKQVDVVEIYIESF